MNQNIQINTEIDQWARVSQWCIRLIALAFTAQIFLSFQLWFPIHRTYPELPFFAFFPLDYPTALSCVLSASFIISLLGASYSWSKQKTALTIALLLFFALVLEDINRFQPWGYIYSTILAVIGWNNYRDSSPKRAIISLQFILAMVYVWSGIHKLNVQFVQDVFPWLVGIFECTEWLKDFPLLAYGVGIFELVLGILLLLPYNKKIAILLGGVLHGSILLLLITDNWNSVVYPWNVAMPLLLYILFGDTQHPSFSLKKALFPYQTIVILFGLVPFLYLFQLTPNWIALSLYAGTTMECDLVVNNSGVANCFPASVQGELLDFGESQALSLDTWGLNELNVPPLASEYTYKEVGRHFCACAAAHQGYIIFYYPQKWENTDKRVIFTCEELLD